MTDCSCIVGEFLLLFRDSMRTFPTTFALYKDAKNEEQHKSCANEDDLRT